jgi:hypothetical protein
MLLPAIFISTDRPIQSPSQGLSPSPISVFLSLHQEPPRQTAPASDLLACPHKQQPLCQPPGVGISMSSAAVVFRCVSRPVNQDERTSDVRSTSTSQRRILGVLFPPCLCSKGLQKQPRLITTICELRQEVLDELFSVCQYTCLDRFWGSLHRNAHLALRNKYSHIQPFPQ